MLVTVVDCVREDLPALSVYLVSFIHNLSDKPRATLTAGTTIIPVGGSVTLTCSVQSSDGWKYEWFRRTQTTSEVQIRDQQNRDIRVSQGGIYSCRGTRGNPVYYTDISDDVTIEITFPSKPTVTLQPSWTQIYSGETVTVRCEIQGGEGAQWTYEWRKSSEALTTQDAVFHSNGQISVSQEGLYRCRGGRGNPVYYTEDTSNRPVVTLYPNWSEIYRGETITVRCEIHGGDTEWETNSRIKAPNQNEYRIRSASSSNSGNYRCKGRMKSSQHQTTEWSDSVTLTVSDNKPRPVLTVSPSWLSPGASVTLNCEVEHPSAGWSFYWYKAVPDLSEKSSSYELLPDGSGTAQDSYIIHGQTHTAGYVCRAGRGDPEYHTDHSQPKFVWSADVHSAASLTVSPDRVQHFTSDSVSLTCEGNFTEWRVRKFSEDGRLYSDCRRMTGSTCNINTSKSDTAVYWCESGSGEFSSAVNITVQNDGNGPILVSPVHPFENTKILSNVFFYHNDKLIQNDTRGELKISAVSKSDEGFYKCQYSGRESAQSWMSVKADSSSSPVWLIVGLVCGVSLIIILLLLLYHCRQSKCKSLFCVMIIISSRDGPIRYYVSAEVERVLKICTQVQVLLHWLNCTQLQVKVLVLKKYLSKSTKYSSQKLLRVLITF
uniref:Ig-like domain-containing protein n=1 Tax=Oreochromis aureus TaxID=47969 RepID=A0AAZ1X0Q3_OREAU